MSEAVCSWEAVDRGCGGKGGEVVAGVVGVDGDDGVARCVIGIGSVSSSNCNSYTGSSSSGESLHSDANIDSDPPFAALLALSLCDWFSVA